MSDSLGQNPEAGDRDKVQAELLASFKQKRSKDVNGQPGGPRKPGKTPIAPSGIGGTEQLDQELTSLIGPIDEDMQIAGEKYMRKVRGNPITREGRMWASDGFAKGWVASRDRKDRISSTVPAGSLAERRTIFVYEGARLAALAANAPIIPEAWDKRDDAFKKQMIEVVEMMSGSDRKTSPEELHDDWVKAYEELGWVYGPVRDVEKKTHPDMVGYWELGQLERDKDAVFVALCEIARQWVY